MPDIQTVASLFQEAPPQWGLRGDPYLWQEMRDYFRQTPLPATADELSALITAAFESLTGHPISTAAPVFVERFSHGGMSSGQTSPTFWREDVVSFLRERYAAI